MVAIVIAAAATAAVVDAKYAPHGSRRAADTGSDRSADDAADRAANPVAFPGALLRAAHDALCMPDMGDREQCKHDGRECKIAFYGQPGWHRRRFDPGLRLHINSLCLIAVSRWGGNL
jgi:hypothetical protein